MTATDQLRATTAKYLIPYLFIHVPIVWLSGFVTGNDTTMAVLLTLVFAVIPAVSWKATGVSVMTRFLTAVSFMLIVAVLVYAFRGHPWQIDMHMYFFAGLAMLVGFSDWRVYVMATVVIALHHIMLNFTMAAWVFPDGADFARVVIHAVIVVLETAVLAGVSFALNRAMDASTEAQAKAEVSSNEASQALQRQREVEDRADEDRKSQLHQIAVDLEEQVGSIVSSVNDEAQSLRGLSQGMSGAAANVGERAQNASNAAQGITMSVESVASASEQLSASVDEISRQVVHSQGISQNAAELASAATENVQTLSARVADISEVVNLIADIANQTNLLALNATIEAARAGEAGKGIAVVASEVKNLANQTAKATEQIESQISTVVSATDNTVGGIETINVTVGEVLSTSSAIATAVEEQAAAIREIAGHASKTAQDVVVVSSSVAEVREGASGNVERAGDVQSASENLQSQANALSGHVESFLGKLKSS